MTCAAMALPGPPDRPKGYSHAVLRDGIVALAGQLPEAALVDGAKPFAQQFLSALRRLLTALDQEGGQPQDLLHIRFYVTDLAAYSEARESLANPYRELLDGHYPAATLIEVAGLLGGGAVEIDGLAVRSPAPLLQPGAASAIAVIRLRLAPADARYAGGLVAGSKAMEIFSDLQTELALREGGDEGLLAAYESVQFLLPLRAGDFVEGRASVVSRGRTSRRVQLELWKVAGPDLPGDLDGPANPIIAVRATGTIVVGRNATTEE